MDILIRGMEMPKDDCEAYRQIIITNNLVDGKIQMLAHDANTNEFIGEVVELPQHGDLIDRDYLKQTHCAECTLYPGNCLEKSGEECDWESIAHLNMCPVVIPAEEGE